LVGSKIKAPARQHKWRAMLHWHTKDISRGTFVRIVVCSKCVVIFGIRGPRVIDLNAVVTIEVVAVRGENAAAVGRAVLNTVLGRLCHEAAQRLNTALALKPGVILLHESVNDISKLVIVNAVARFLNIALLLLSVDSHLENPFLEKHVRNQTWRLVLPLNSNELREVKENY
jgi:hypothetical protein